MSTEESGLSCQLQELGQVVNLMLNMAAFTVWSCEPTSAYTHPLPPAGRTTLIHFDAPKFETPYLSQPQKSGN